MLFKPLPQEKHVSKSPIVKAVPKAKEDEPKKKKKKKKGESGPSVDPLTPAQIKAAVDKDYDKNNTEIRIYCDGSCNSKNRVGGWGAVLFFKGRKKEIFGGKLDTTNNQMEMTAAIEALKSLKTNKHEVIILSDSAYLVNGITSWVEGWAKRKWVTSTGTPVLNKDLWKKLMFYRRKFNIRWQWVKGHAGNPHNERADELAGCGAWMIANPDPDKPKRLTKDVTEIRHKNMDVVLRNGSVIKPGTGNAIIIRKKNCKSSTPKGKGGSNNGKEGASKERRSTSKKEKVRGGARR
jgi:ribonuclease HI